MWWVSRVGHPPVLSMSQRLRTEPPAPTPGPRVLSCPQTLFPPGRRRQSPPRGAAGAGRGTLWCPRNAGKQATISGELGQLSPCPGAQPGPSKRCDWAVSAQAAGALRGCRGRSGPAGPVTAAGSKRWVRKGVSC